MGSRRKKPGSAREKTSAELLSDLSVRVFQAPLDGIRTSGAIADLSRPMSVVMLLIDFDTEVAMNGIVDFLGNSTGRYAAETVAALRHVGCADEASVLKKILDVARRAGMTHAAIQEDLSELEEYTVTTFQDVHGTKWEQACETISRLGREIDFEKVARQAERFVGEHRGELLAELEGAR